MNERIKAHFAFLRTLFCVVPGCLNNVSVEVAHVRYSDAASDKINPGMQRKDHRHVVCLCSDHHRQQHEGNERAWWDRLGVNPIVLARQLWKHTGDAETCERLIRKWGLH